MPMGDEYFCAKLVTLTTDLRAAEILRMLDDHENWAHRLTQEEYAACGHGLARHDKA